MTMISSMTGFARQTRKTAWGELAWSLRSLNNRSLDIHIHLPEHFRPLEAKCRRRLVDSFSRGRIDAALFFVRAPSDLKTQPVDESTLLSLLTYAHKIQEHAPAAPDLTVSEILRWPGVIRNDDEPGNELFDQAVELLAESTEALIQDRGREGKLLQEILQVKLREFKNGSIDARKLVPEAQQKLQERMAEKVAELKIEVDPGRLEQEIAMALVKLDVGEELDRIELHIAEMEKVLTEQAVAGKRLGFLLQELGREVNTLGSKTIHYPLNALAVDLKVTLEQMREQVHNVE